MDAMEINYQLKRLGKSQSGLARELGVTPGIVNNVIHGRTTCFAVAAHIAKLLQSEPILLWPERYVFKPRQTKRNSITQGEAS
jgi:Ner family transcriptional regulator